MAQQLPHSPWSCTLFLFKAASCPFHVKSVGRWDKSTLRTDSLRRPRDVARLGPFLDG